MTFTEMATIMYPYWMLGIFIIFATYQSSYRDLLRIQKESIGKWILCLAAITAYRFIIFSIFSTNEKLHSMTSAASFIPWQATFTVFWEDASYVLPLVIFSLCLGQNKLWKKILTYAMIAMVSVSFGLGHMYQGYAAAAFLSLYVPFTFKKGQEVGFGTVMICHILYDLTTILTIKNFLR
jgi:hypothetical protein